MIKKIEMPDVRGVIIREPINIDEPIILDDHIPHPRPYTNDRLVDVDRFTNDNTANLGDFNCLYHRHSPFTCPRARCAF